MPVLSSKREWAWRAGALVLTTMLGCSSSDAEPSSTGSGAVGGAGSASQGSGGGPLGGTGPGAAAGSSSSGGVPPSSESGGVGAAGGGAEAGSSSGAAGAVTGGAGAGGAGAGGGGASGGGASAGGAGAGGSGAGGSLAGGSGAGGGTTFSQYQPVPSGKFDEVKLFSGDPPNFKKGAPAENIGAGGRIYDVSVPTVRRYPMDVTKATGIGFVVFPGGGYDHLDIERHATALANRMGPQGIAVFGLKYRVGDGTSDVRRDALLDANRAIRVIREHAAAWGVASDRLGVVSYSAGSHLAMNFAGHFDLGQATSADSVERQSSRPSFFASMCTWDSGNSTSKFTFLASTPPIYMCHAQDDQTAPIALAYAIEKQLQTLKVLEHVEVYASGAHDSFNVGEKAAGKDWPDKFMTWLRANALVP